MTFSDEQRKQLVAWRLAKADQALDDASTLLGRGSSGGAVNRCYYAVFHAASALAIRDSRTFRKHSALISFFHREYIKTGRLSEDLGQIFQETFIHRGEADYQDLVDLPLDMVTRLLENARRFVGKLKSLLETA